MHPVALAVGDDRRLEVQIRRRPLVVQAFGQLERTLDVLTCGLQVAAAPVAARAPRENVRAGPVGRDLRALGELERFVEETDRRLDAGELVARNPEPEEHVRALHVREDAALAQHARPLQEPDRLSHLAAAHADRRLARECAYLELGNPGRRHGRLDGDELLERLVVPPRLEQRVGPGQRRVDAAALVGGDAVGQEPGVDAETVGDPFDRLLGRLRLAALDLADVFLGEPVAGQIRLRHTCGHAEVPEPLAEPEAGLGGQGPLLLGDGGRLRHLHRSSRGQLHQTPAHPFRHHPKRSCCRRKPVK